MSAPIPLSEEIPAFVPYVAGQYGTVIGHEAGSYVVLAPNGSTYGYPAHSGEPSEANAVADIAYAIANPPAMPCPLEVSPWQIRRALNAAGLRATVEAAVAAADQDTRDGWEFATMIRRDNAMLAGMAAALGLTDMQVDQLFITAASYNQ